MPQRHSTAPTSYSWTAGTSRDVYIGPLHAFSQVCRRPPPIAIVAGAALPSFDKTKHPPLWPAPRTRPDPPPPLSHSTVRTAATSPPRMARHTHPIHVEGTSRGQRHASPPPPCGHTAATRALRARCSLPCTPFRPPRPSTHCGGPDENSSRPPTAVSFSIFF